MKENVKYKENGQCLFNVFDGNALRPYETSNTIFLQENIFRFSKFILIKSESESNAMADR